MKIETTDVVVHDGESVPIGSVLDLPKKHADALLSVGVAKKAAKGAGASSKKSDKGSNK